MDYINFALAEDCQPVFVDPEQETCPPSILDRSVLDERCQDWELYLSLSEPESVDEIKLKNSLKSFFALNDLTGERFVLSLSGGVDSMSMAVLLSQLRVNFVAVHIRHSSRLEDTEKELNWVKFVCRGLKIPLYYHHVLVARPHGEDNIGELTRDIFEEKTRDIRFSMYAKAFKSAFGNAVEPRVLIGHHIDDVDENRIAELGKGNLINIDGMSESSAFADVVQLRPLCGYVRKNVIRNFALHRKIPHMHNSTPKWSRRGWIREVLDFGEQRESFLEQLQVLGAHSSQIDQAISQLAKEWMNEKGMKRGRELRLQSKTKNISIACHWFPVDRLIERMRTLGIVEQLECMCLDAKNFGDQWNEYYMHFASSERPGMNCPIQPVKLTQYNSISGIETEIINRVFQCVFGDIRTIVGTEKFIAKKSVAQLLEAMPSKSSFSWKVAHKDLLMVNVRGEWFLLMEVDANTKKAISTNLDKVDVVDS